LEGENSEFIKNIKWEILTEAVKNCKEEVKIEGFKR
jgi:hypothetical protein